MSLSKFAQGAPALEVPGLELRSKFDRTGRCLVQNGRIQAKCSKFEQNSAKMLGVWAKCGANSGKMLQMLAKFGQDARNLGNMWCKIAEFGQNARNVAKCP